MNTEKKSLAVKELLPATIWGLLSLIPIGLYILTIPHLVIEKIVRKQKFSELGFRIKGFGEAIRKNWWLIILPAALGLSELFLSKLISPEYMNHVIERVRPTLNFDQAPVLIIQIVLLSLAEEISFRAFMQRKMSLCIKPMWAIFIVSLLFAVAHFSTGSPIVVAYDLIGIFIDSVIYGLLFQRTKSVYVSWLSHMIANLTGALIVFVI